MVGALEFVSIITLEFESKKRSIILNSLLGIVYTQAL
jgi:hypothetical protein